MFVLDQHVSTQCQLRDVFMRVFTR